MIDVMERSYESGAPRKRNTFADLYHERTTYRFIAHTRRWMAISGALVLISIFAFVFRGLNLGIEFEGGTQLGISDSAAGTSIGGIRDVIDPLGLTNAKVLILGGNGARVQFADTSTKTVNEVRAALAQYAGFCENQDSCTQAEVEKVSLSTVGPTWGDKVSDKALQALVVFFLVLALYLTFRFEFRMAMAALIAVVHDIIITIGVYAVTGFEVTPATVVAFLTILGFSLYDTVVVFDKVKENEGRLGTVAGDTYSDMVNRSLNQVLMRSLNTSIVAVLPVASLLFVGTFVLGGQTLKDFALALFVGLIVGAYSSIFVATPILAVFKERQPKYRALRERAAVDLARRASAAPAAPATIETMDDAEDEVFGDDAVLAEGEDELLRQSTPESAPPSPPPSSSRAAATPRPRQQRSSKKRKRR
ncbi:MAG: protein translocase subunit SecF [Acidimicrobiia bacterium]